MPETLKPTPSITAATITQIDRMSAYLLHLLSFVPDERLEWMPSTTSRSALRIVAHCALVNRGFTEILEGRRPAIEPSPEAFFTALRAAECEFATRDEVSAVLREATTGLIRAVEAIDAETIDTPRSSPFGAFPARFWTEQSVGHLTGHMGQLTYLQTIWGDLDDHMG